MKKILAFICAVAILFQGQVAFAAPLIGGKAKDATAPLITEESTEIATYNGEEGDPYAFRIIPLNSATYTIQTISTIDTIGELFQSDNPTSIVTDDDGGEDGNFKITQYLEAGTTYYLCVVNYTVDGDVVTLNITGGGLSTEPPVLNTTNPSDGRRGTVYAGHTFTATGGTGDISYTVTSGALPTGLSLASNGALSGIPTEEGSFTFTVTATDSATTPISDSHSYTILIGAPFSTDAELKASSTVKGVTVTSLGTPNASLGSGTAGAVTITAAKAADTSNATTFVTLFDSNDTNATVKAVKYASGTTDFSGFDGAMAYTNATIADGDFFIVRVRAEDSTTINYYRINVTVTAAPSTAKAITAFDFNGLTPAVTGTVNEGAKTIALSVPYGTDVTALVPSITHSGASVSPNTGVAQNFTNSVTYTVTAADSSTQQYTVTVTAAPSTAKAITAFDFNGLTPAVTGTVNEGAKTIALSVPYGTDVTALVPSITHSGASVSPNTGVAQNFTNSVTYTVTAEDSSTQQYTVTVTVAPSTAKAITAFDFNGLTPAVTGTVNEGAKTIALTVPYGTDVTALVPSITHSGASVSPNAGVAQNFTSPVTYTVTAADNSTQEYMVTVTVAPSTAKAITAFDFNGLTPAVTGTVNEGAKTIALTVPYGTNVTALLPSITHTGASVSPNTGVAHDFTSPVIYTVKAADNSTQTYTVTVTVALSTAKAITAFTFNGLTPAVTGTVNEGAKTIALTVPYGTNVTALVPSITHTGASVSPNTGVAHDFTSPVIYTVTAADNSTQTYTVTVTVAPSTAKAITAFDFNGLTPAVTGTVNEGTKTIALTVPYGTDVTALVPTIAHTGASVSPNTGVAQNFTSPVTYTVTAADSSTQQYTVTVTVAPSTAKAITAFDFNGLTPAVTGTVNEGAKTIALTVPYGTDVTALVPNITHTGASVSPNTGVAQNFTSPVTYTVTAADNSTQEYMVTVTVAPSTAKAITAFTLNGLTPAVTGTVNEGAKTIALTVPYGTDVTALVPSITHTGASVSPNTGVVQNFTSPVTYTVTAADSSTQQYSVTVKVGVSSNSDLSALSISSGTLSPAFANGTKSYTASVGHGVSSITVTPTVADSNATVTVNGTTIASGNASGVINLNVGANIITVVVTAQDGATTSTYTVTVTRAGASSGGSSSGSSSGGTTPATTQPSRNTIVVVNGKEQNAGKETQKTEGGKSIVTVAVDNKAVESKIDEAIKANTTGTGNVIQIPVADTKSEVAKVELTGDIVKKLEENTFDVSVKRDNVEYIIPAEEFTISKVAENLGLKEKNLADIKVEVKISKLDEKAVERYNEVAKANGAELVFPPVEFEIVAKTTNTDGRTKEQSINKFSNYVERVMEIPAGVDPSKITTGIVFNTDGTYSHVPTEVYQRDGKWYARLNSLTNSDYSVIWNPVTVKSVENHWAKDAVNDMASRLVIFNPEEFEPNKAITRADFAEYIVRALGLYREGLTHDNNFKDISDTGERTLAILIANEYGIVSGYSDGTFRGDNRITREEAMAMYQRAMKITNLVGSNENRFQNYTDYSEVSDWAKANVKNVLSAHVFNGTSETKISPKASLTYAEAAQAIRNLLVESKLISE